MAKPRKKSYLAHHMTVNKKKSVTPNLKVPVSTIYTYRSYRPPSDRDEQLKLLQEYVEWSFTTTSTNPIDFPLEKRINPHYFFKLREISELFNDMIEFVQYKFSSTLEKNPLVSPQYTTSRIRYYDKDFGKWFADEVKKVINARQEVLLIKDADWAQERKKDD